MKLGRKFLKASDVQNGDHITFRSEGQWQESQFKNDDGSMKQQFVIEVELNGALQQMALNKTNRDVLVASWGDETRDWKGKTAVAEKMKIMVAGKPQETILLNVEDIS